MRPRIESDAPDLVTPDTLQRLVTIRAANARPIKPDVECMARTVYHEASNQALRGQLAVAQVILNRTRTDVFPRTVCGVVGQPGQFSHGPMTAAAAASGSWHTAVAISAIAEEDHVAQVAPGALFFHAAYVRPAWSQTHERIAQIGDHIFYR